MSDQSAVTHRKKALTSPSPAENGKPTSLNNIQVADALSIGKSSVKKLRRQKRLPGHIGEDFIRDLQKDS
jgi:hypothetical protein